MNIEIEGASCFRHALICSLLVRRSIKIVSIHPELSPPGIQDYEANFLKFLDKVTDGSKMSVSPNRTDITFTPGSIIGGSFAHEVPTSRGVGYIFEAAIHLLPFAKYPSEVTLTGATQHPDDISPDIFRTVTAKWLQLFGVDAELRIVRRGAGVAGGGCVILSCRNVRKLKSIDVNERGKFRRVRGICFGSRVASDLLKRCATSAKGKLLQLLPDVHIVTDMADTKTNQCGSGYGVMLVAESTSKKIVISQECCAEERVPPEEIGEKVAALLLTEVWEGGCLDSAHQLMIILLMSVTPDDVSTVRMGQLSQSAVSGLVLAEKILGVSFAVKEEPSLYGEGYVHSTVVTCLGNNLTNVAMKSG